MATVKLNLDGPVAWLTLNDPERHNVLTGQAIEQFRSHLKTVESSDETRVLVVTGTGNRTFCAGASLDELQTGVITEHDFEALARSLAGLSVPKIAAMNGNAYGGGAEIGLCCDFRIGVRGMKLRVPAAQIGLCYPPEGIDRYVRELGPGAAKRLLVAAQAFTAEELLRIGYLLEVCAPEALAGRAAALAADIAGLAPLAVQAMLSMCKAAAGGQLDPVDTGRRMEACKRSADLQEGLQAALRKRKPVFRGR
ncbi:MAG: enoyl-CoA hydratase/isomerase family protein [Lysobacterales bacterium]